MKKKYDLNLKEIGNRLKQTRDSIGMTLEKMHQATGFSTSLISAAENGQKKPSAIYLFALLKLFDVNLNYIFSGQGDMFLTVPPGKKEKAGFDDTYQEMLYMLDKVPIVKYALMSEYLIFKTNHTETINKFIEEKKMN